MTPPTTVVQLLAKSELILLSFTFSGVQLGKNDLDALLFIFTALGSPMSAIVSGFVATRIWTLRGGVD